MILETEVEKRCARCGEWWPADTEFFPRRAASKDGLDSWCKACRSEYHNARYAARKRR